MNYVAGPYGAKATRTPALAVLAMVCLASFGNGLADRLASGPIAADAAPVTRPPQTPAAPAPDPSPTPRLEVEAPGPPESAQAVVPRLAADAPRPGPTPPEPAGEPLEPAPTPAAGAPAADASAAVEAMPQAPPTPVDTQEDPVS